MNKKVFIIIATLALIASFIVTAVIIQQNPNPLNAQGEKTYCSTWFGVGWYQKEGIMVFADYDTKQASNDYVIGVKVTNNNTQTLFRVHVDLSYKTSSGSWSTISVPNIGMIDISDTKHTTVSLADPFLSTWETQEWTLPTMSCDDVKVIVYGYTVP